jgi:hypothetical protein
MVDFKQFLLACLVLLLLTANARATDCTSLSLPDPGKGFLANFSNECYIVPLKTSFDTGTAGGDRNTTYDVMFYRIDPRYELVFIGEFPKARFFSWTIYDDHVAVSDTLLDRDFQPVTSNYINPFHDLQVFEEDQLYVGVIDFGGRPVRTAYAGCSLDGAQLNRLDATKRHKGITWNDEPNLPSSFPLHEDDNIPNTAGLILVRRYLQAEDKGTFQLAGPQIIVRDLRTGCAIPNAQVPSLEILTPWPGGSWYHYDQVYLHRVYTGIFETAMCYVRDDGDALQWTRGPEYNPGAPNPHSGYLFASFSESLRDELIDDPRNLYMRIRFRLPSIPTFPCDGCVLSGGEELRYFSLSFLNSATTIASLSDLELVRDSEGFVSLIVSFGDPRPSWVTSENGYTYLDLSHETGFDALNRLFIRTIAPSPTFSCVAQAVPYFTSEQNPLGGFMGEYAPMTDFPLEEEIPFVAEAHREPNLCGVLPIEPPVPCEN